MAYRGDDLDLRTPQARGGSGREGDQPNWWTRTAVYKGGRADPIWVDDNVMACCNHAYDLALAHRAPEVRLEHLINALTLNDHASLVLEARGLSVASLRRESGSSIANDIPAAAGAYNGAPKRSEGLEEALRQAADHAYPRRTPVSVDDVLHVLFDMKRDLPGLQLLHRHATSWSRNGADPRADLRIEPLPHLARPQASPRYNTAADYFSEPARYTSAPRERDYVRETPREPLRTAREPAPTTPVDTFQDARLDSLERLVRDIGVDLADDRKTIRSLVGDLQRSTAVQADDSGRFRGNLNDRLASLEDTMARARNDSAGLPSALLDRIGMLERTIDTRLAEAGRGSAVPQMLLDRIAGMERMIDARLAEAGERSSGPSPALLDRLASIERGIEARLIDMGRATMAMNERLQSLEQVSQRPVEASLSPLVSQRLEAITQFGSKVDTLERTFQLILDRMTGIERKVADARPTIDLSGVENRLAGLERSVQKTVEASVDMTPVTDLLSGIEGRVAGLERTLDNRSAETGRTVSFIGERLRAFEEAIGGQKTHTVDRLGQIERSLTAYAESTVAAGSSHESDLGEVHEALLKLNANQQTLAGSLDQWRLDNTGDLSVISNRLKVMEDVEQRRAPMVENLTAQVGAVHSALAKREVRKSRFLHWLFGTDEWYSASWDTKRWRASQGDPLSAPLRTAETVQIQQRPTPPAPPPSILRR